MDACPLCAGVSVPFHRAERDYLRCGICALTFVPATQHLTEEAERARYATHRNSPEDPGYRAFLDRLLAPMSSRLEPGARGLDFGSGPGPTASVMMRERGFNMSDWDPHFAPDAAPLSSVYDFVVCTEVAEHMRRPAEAFKRLDSLLVPGGALGVLTGTLEYDEIFPDWWYRKDPTHIAFYKPATMDRIAIMFGWALERLGRDAWYFRKPA